MKKILIIVAVIIVSVSLVSLRVISRRRGAAESLTAKASLLGISVRDMADADRDRLKTDRGVLISAIHANSIAEQRGLKEGDAILAINDESFEKESGYQEVLNKALMQTTMTFQIKRGSEEKQIRLITEYASAYNNLGNAYLKDKLYEQAIDAYQKALSIDPEFALAYYNLGTAYAKQEKYDLAIENYRKAIERRDNFREALQKVAEIYSQQGKYEDAVKTYKEMMQSSPADTITSDMKSVEVIYAGLGEIKSQLRASGTIEPSARVTVFPKAAGVVEQMKADQGSIVKKDQVLAVVEHEELELQVRQAESALAAAQAGYDQAVQLAEIRTMSQVAQARAGAKAAEAALQQVSDLAKTRTDAQIQQAEAALDALKANQEKIQRGAREEEREQVKATVAQAEANLTNVQSNYERMDKLFKDGAISKQTHESIQTQLEVAKAQHRAAQQQWKMVQDGARQEDISAMDAQVKQAEAGFMLAKAQSESQTWQKDIAMAEAQAAQANAALESAEMMVKAKSWEAEITGAETQLTQAKIMLDLARKRFSDAYMKAPIGGIVSIRHLDEGSMVSPAAPVFEIVDMEKVHANVEVIESDLSKIKINDNAWIGVKAFNEDVKGRITSISPTVDEMSRSAKVEVTVENPEHLLKPGMFARVLIPTDTRSASVILPSGAVLEDAQNGEKYVFVVQSGRSVKTIVESGLVEKNRVEIIKGLGDGVPVIISGQQSLNDGDFVQVVRVIE